MHEIAELGKVTCKTKRNCKVKTQRQSESHGMPYRQLVARCEERALDEWTLRTVRSWLGYHAIHSITVSFERPPIQAKSLLANALSGKLMRHASIDVTTQSWLT